MNRITEKLSKLKNQDKKVLACFLTAGFPNIDSTCPLVIQLEKAGVDIIELGMPFSDPLADGQVIQHSSQIALRNGVTIEKIFSFVKDIRHQSEIPIVLMGYLNPILAYGERKFFSDAVKAGVDGLILPELPFEESERYRLLIEKSGLANILLVAPTTPVNRIKQIDKVSSGFLYCVSTTGVTGTSIKNKNIDYIRKVKRIVSKNSVLVGFGIKTPQDANCYAQYANGVIIGSALIKKIMQKDPLDNICEWIRQIKLEMNK